MAPLNGRCNSLILRHFGLCGLRAEVTLRRGRSRLRKRDVRLFLMQPPVVRRVLRSDSG
jgi:hypothetical protein